MYHTHSNWTKILEERQTLWKHDGNPKRPHALLTSGGHSDGFFAGKTLLYDDCRLGMELCFDFVESEIKPRLVGRSLSRNDLIVLGPAFGAVSMAPFIAAALGVGCAYAISSGEGEDKTFAIEKRFQGDLKQKLVLPVEDVVTTGGSALKAARAAWAQGGLSLLFLATICNRSGLKEVEGEAIVSMFDIPMTNWDVSKVQCPLCAQGSEAIRPKDGNNWARLTAHYN